MKTYFYASVASAMILGSCAPKVMILQSPVISMTAADSGSAKELAAGKHIDEKWCARDKPAHENDDGSKHYGMIDQVVWKAHHESKAALFKDAKFYQQGECVFMSAEAVEGGGSQGVTPPAATPAPAKERPKAKGHKG